MEINLESRDILNTVGCNWEMEPIDLNRTRTFFFSRCDTTNSELVALDGNLERILECDMEILDLKGAVLAMIVSSDFPSCSGNDSSLACL